MKWFRFYSEVLHDSKVQTLHPELFRAWVNLLCLANEGPTRGTIPGLKQVAFALRVRDDKAAAIVDGLTACGLLDRDEDGTMRPHNWEHRQRQSDDTAARVRQHRRRKTPVTRNDDVTLHATECDSDEKRECNPRARSDSDTDTEQKPPLPPVPGGATTARIAPLPEGAEEAIAEARVRVNDDAAEILRREAESIDRQLGGRFDLFLEALEAAQNRRPKLEVRHVFSWAMRRALGRLADPPREPHRNGTILSPAERATPAPDPAKVASKGCEHCGGEGLVTVYHPAPDPARRIPASTAAACVCGWGRAILAKRSIPDFADVLAGRGPWLPEPPEPVKRS